MMIDISEEERGILLGLVRKELGDSGIKEEERKELEELEKVLD